MASCWCYVCRVNWRNNSIARWKLEKVDFRRLYPFLQVPFLCVTFLIPWCVCPYSHILYVPRDRNRNFGLNFVKTEPGLCRFIVFFIQNNRLYSWTFDFMLSNAEKISTKQKQQHNKGREQSRRTLRRYGNILSGGLMSQ